jgi:hypothetical protein
MSVKVSSWVWHEAPVTDRSELLVLLALADHASDDGGSAYPSVNTLAAKARLSRRAVFDALARLKASGLIVPDGTGPRGTVAYRVCMGVQSLHHPVHRLHGADAASVRPATPGGADSGTQGVRQAAPEPSFEPSDEPSFSSGARVDAHEGGGQGQTPSEEERMAAWAGTVAEYLQRSVDGLSTTERCKPASAVEVLRLLREYRPTWELSWAVAVDTRGTVQAQDRAPNIVGLYGQKLRKALAEEAA